MGRSLFNAKGCGLYHDRSFANVAIVPMPLHKLTDLFHFVLGFPRMLLRLTLRYSTQCFILRIRK